MCDIKKLAYRSLILSFLFLFTFTSCLDDTTGPEAKAYKVSYKISGTAKSVNVTMENKDGGTSQYSGVSVPKTYNLGSIAVGKFVYISAQNNGNSGSVIVQILRNDRVWKESKSSGAYVIATASGSL